MSPKFNKFFWGFLGEKVAIFPTVGLFEFWDLLPDTPQVIINDRYRTKILKYNSKASQRRIFHKNILNGFLEI